MDSSYARRKLDEYVALLNEYGTYTTGGRPRQEVADDLVRAQPTLREVLLACGQSMLSTGVYEQSLKDHRQQILRAYGVLDDLVELTKARGPRGPQLQAQGLHSWVWEVAAPLWSSGHHRQAVAAAAGNLSLKVQAKLDRWDVADDALMTEALSPRPPAAGRPRLRVPATPGRPFEEALQEGALSFARGVFSLLRNPATHNVTEVWSEQRALEALAALSVLARALDGATVEQVESTES